VLPLPPSFGLRSVWFTGDDNAEMQLGDRGGADPTFEIAWALAADQHRGIEDDGRTGRRVTNEVKL
jgi:hypothetical protein